MDKRKLGHTGFAVAPLAFGGNVFGWTVDEATSFCLLDAFVDAGFNLIDTADSYSRWVPGHEGGESETIIGRWIARRGRHDDVVIATKVGSDMGFGYQCLRADYIVQAVERSLTRLQVGAIDLYQSHWDDDKTSFDETLEAYARLLRQGKVRAIGASNLTAQRLTQALEVSRQHGYPSYATLQPLYNLYDRGGFEGALEAVCAREQVGVITYFSLAAGFLTGKYRTAADFTKSPRGAGHAEVPQPPRPAHPRRAGRGCATLRGYAGTGGAGLAAGATGRHRAHRQRNLPRAAHRVDRGDAASARCRCDAAT